MNKVISFPEHKMTRVKRLHRLEAKNTTVILSAASFLMLALFVNDSLNRQPGPMYIVSDNGSNIATLNRAIASAQPMNVFRDLEWEKKMADKLGKADRIPAAVYGKTATATDQLRFGALAGKYFFSQQEDMKLSEIRYVDSRDVGDRPVFMDPDTFLKAYGRLLSVEFSEYSKLDSTTTNVQDYRLLGQDRKVVGTASFTLDEEGRFLSLRVSTN